MTRPIPIAILAIALWAAPVVAAQANAFALTGAGGVAFVRDDLLVPRTFTGPRLGFGLEYTGEAGPGLVELSIDIGLAYALDRDGYQSAALDYGLGARYLFRLGPALGFQHWLGPAFGWNTDVSLLESWDDAHGYWIGSRWLGPAWHAFQRIGQDMRLDLAAELSLFGLMSRPESYRRNKQDALTHVGFYFVEVQSDPTIVWLADLQHLSVSAKLWWYTRAAQVPVGWAVGADLRFSHAAEPSSAIASALLMTVTHAWGW